MYIQGGKAMQSHIRKQLLDAFAKAGDAFISGQSIAEITGSSRTAIWKHIEALRQDGYTVEAVRRKGYRITGVPEKMSADSIRMALKETTFGEHIYYYDSVESTQKVANELAGNGATEGTIIVADQQTGGRGRLARKWFSPQNTGVWMSLIIKPNIPIYQAPQLTLLTAVAAAKAIEEHISVAPYIKWPNDILLNNKKITGILTEMQAEADSIHSIVIGIGINVNQKLVDFPEELQTIASSLHIETGHLFAREEIISSFLRHFESIYKIYQKEGFTIVKELWESYAISVGKKITATTINEKIVGIALGITDQGVLLIKDEQGQVHSIYSADIEI